MVKKQLDALNRAVDKSGGRKAFVESLGINYSTIQKWRERGVPARWVLKIEEVSGISRHDLDPDLYPR